MFVVRRTRPRDPERIQQEMEAVFRTLMPGRPAVGHPEPALWRPPLEVYETDEALIVSAEIAGMDESHLKVVVDGDMLVLRGSRPDPRHAEKRCYHEARIPYGAFGADVYIPFPVDPERTEADYTNGFLRIVLPRTVARTIVPRQPVAGAEREEGAR
jgi:HSP20 family protein